MSYPRYTRQPQCPVEIDWGHPLAKGLRSSLFNSSLDAVRTYDYVQRRTGTLETGGIVSTQGDVVHRSPNGAGFVGRDIAAPNLSDCRFLTLAWWEWIDSYTSTHFGIGYVTPHNSLMINPASDTGRMEFWIADTANNGGTQRATIQGITRPATGSWHHIVWLIDLDDNVNKGFTAIKVNLVTQGLTNNGSQGNMVAPMRLTAGTLMNFSTTAISGGTRNPSRWRNFAIWNRQLSDAEQRQHYLNPWMFLRPAGRGQVLVDVRWTPLAPPGVSVPLVGLPRVRYTRQPQAPVTIDKGHPLARGLIACALSSGADAMGPPTNLVTGQHGVAAKLQYATTPDGVVQRFNGTDAYSTVPVDLSPYRRVTISFKAQFNAALADTIAVEYSANWNSNAGFILDPNDGGFSFAVSGAGGAGGAGGRHTARITSPAVGASYRYAVLIDRNVAGSPILAIYRDGVAMAITSPTATFVASDWVNSVFYLGARSGVAFPTACQISDFTVHNRLLSELEIKQLHANPWQMVMPAPTRYMGAQGIISVLPWSRPRFTRQPGQAVLDRGHPMARGLVFAAYHTQQETGAPPRNLVTGAMGSHVFGTTTLTTDPKGTTRSWGGSAGSKVFAPLAGLTKISLAFDLYWPSYANNDAVCFSSENWTTGETMLIDPNGGNGQWAFEYRHTNGNRCVATFARPAAGLHSYVLLFDTSLTSGQAVAAYVDGALQSHSYFSNGIGASGAFRDLNLTFFHHDGPTLQGTGSVRNVKIYNRLLSAVEAIELTRNPWAMLLQLPNEFAIHISTNFAGPYRISGVITAATLPLVGAIVRLYREASGELLRTTTTNALGQYKFGTKEEPLTPNEVHTVIAYDALTGYQYNGGILRGLIPGN